MTIDVMVSDTMQLSRSALVALLEEQVEISVVGSASSSHETLELAAQYRPNIVVISAEGADTGGVVLAEKIATIPECRSLLLGTAFSRSVVRRAFTGTVGGLVHKSAPPRQFFEAIHQVHHGQRVFDTELTLAMLRNTDLPLTPREIAVLEQVSLGDTVPEIAARVHLSEGTVRNYLSSTVAKLGARNRIDALRIARKANWI